MRFDNYESDYRFQKTVKTNQDKPKRQDESKSKERKKDYNYERKLKRGDNAP